MNDKEQSPLDRYMPRVPPVTTPEQQGFDARPELPVLMLDLVLANGNRLGLPYSYLGSALLSGNERLELVFADRLVVLEGRNLGPLYNHVLAHTARRVETDASPFDDESQETRVTKITVTDRAS